MRDDRPDVILVHAAAGGVDQHSVGGTQPRSRQRPCRLGQVQVDAAGDAALAAGIARVAADGVPHPDVDRMQQPDAQ